jgi:hypothetical protein
LKQRVTIKDKQKNVFTGMGSVIQGEFKQEKVIVTVEGLKRGKKCLIHCG